MSLNPKITDWQNRVVWLVGASSGIGAATALKMANLGATVIVSARREEQLAALAAQSSQIQTMPIDVNNLEQLHSVAQHIQQQHGQIDVVMYCAGHYKPQSVLAFDLSEMKQHLAVNYTGFLHFVDACLPILLQQGHGHLSMIASVAGYRGLPKALAYGPTKAAMQNLADVLYLELRWKGSAVGLINPGWVGARMTAQNDFKMPALITPEQAADEIVSGMARGQFEISFSKRFTLWLKFLNLLPHRLYFKLIKAIAT